MKSLTVVLVLLGIAAGAVFVRYQTLAPCGVLREMVRENASKEEDEAELGAFVAGLTPDALDALIAAAYGPLDPLQCLGVIIGGVRPTEPAPTQTRDTLPRNKSYGSLRVGASRDRATRSRCQHATSQTAQDPWRLAIQCGPDERRPFTSTRRMTCTESIRATQFRPTLRICQRKSRGHSSSGG
jgi:hypothetical protein